MLSGAVLLVAPHSWWPEYYDVTYMGIAALVCAAAIRLAPSALKAPLAIILLLNASGDLGLYQLYRYGIEYDKIIHFASILIATLALSRILGVRRAVLIVIAASLVWESFEFFMDQYFKTRLFGVYHLFILRDTIMDALFDVMGLVTAYLFLRLKSRRKSATVS